MVPEISKHWHWRDLQISEKSTPRQIAKVWVQNEVFKRKGKLEDLVGRDGGEGSWWYGVQYGSTSGPGRGKITARVARGNNYEGEEGTYSIAELFREVIQEKHNPQLFDF